MKIHFHSWFEPAYFCSSEMQEDREMRYLTREGKKEGQQLERK